MSGRGVLTNTHPIALIKTACKIFSKILSDRIFLACSTFDVLRKDNFLVLKECFGKRPEALAGFAKHAEDIQFEKSLVRIKMCSKFIHFFGGIHRDHTNRIMTDFSLTDGYCVHDGLDQEEMFSPLLGCAEFQTGLFSFFAAGAFTMTIPINSRANDPSLFIRRSLISIAKKSEFHQYLGIFLSTEGLSKPSLAKVNLDVHFFTNLVLRKTILDKQLLYLVSVVLHSIVSYRTQFSFVFVGVYNKWDAIIRKGLKLKSGLPLDFPSNMIHYSFFYDLKTFFQVQSEGKVAFLVSFANSDSILDCLFSYRSYDLQVQCWHSIHSLSSPVYICVSASNNFLAGMVHILLDCNLFLDGSLANSFWFRGGVSMLDYNIVFVNQLCDHHGSVFNWHTFKYWKRLDSRGPVLEWFKLSVVFFNVGGSSFTHPSVLTSVGSLNILESRDFVSVLYTDGSLSNLETVGCRAGAAIFFEDINVILAIGVSGLMSSTLVKFSVKLFLDNQSALDVYRSKLGLTCSDFCNQCWIECHHIVNIIHSKNLRVSWHKVKGHSSVLKNECANVIAGEASLSTDGSIVSGNSRHFFCDIYHSVCHACWKIGSGFKFLVGSLLSEVDWLHLSLIWHSDLHITTGFTSNFLANARTYFMKALYYWLLVAIQKHLYNKLYSSVLCLYCSDVEASDHKIVSGFTHSSSSILQLLLFCASDLSLSMALYKGFVFDVWFCEAVAVFHNPKVAGLEIVKFVCSLSLAFRSDIWSVHTKHHAYIEKYGLIPLDGLVLISVFGLVSGLLAGMVKLLSITDAFGVCFGFYKSCLFFSGVNDSVLVHIAV
ncbi:hypothetical protein G9A89_020937 [Geosiphon pyriformis]|nr:hypothetical protein G9A89_020937 [Geosiphon pyriformis]